MKAQHPGLHEPSEYFFHTPSATAQKLFYHVDVCGHFYTDSHYITERQNFGNYLLLLVIKGNLRVRTESLEVDVLPNNIIFLDCHRYHRYWTPEYCEFIYVHFDGSNSQMFYEHITQTIFSNGVFPAGENSSVSRYLRLLLKLENSSGAYPEAYSSQILYSLLMNIITTPRNTAITSEKMQMIDDALKYIDDNLTEPISLNDIAQYIGVSTCHFARMFKQAVGSSPHEFIILARINKAKYLLRTTTDPVCNIAFQVGYSSETSFISSFSSRTGTSPLKFRKMFQAAE